LFNGSVITVTGNSNLLTFASSGLNINGVVTSTGIYDSGLLTVVGTSTLATTTISSLTASGTSTLASTTITNLLVSGTSTLNNLVITGNTSLASSSISALTFTNATGTNSFCNDWNKHTCNDNNFKLNYNGEQLLQSIIYYLMVQ